MQSTSRVWLRRAGLALIIAAFLAAVQFASPNLAGNDGYYHIKLAYLMRTEGLKPAFDWLPLTILNAQEYVDHHFLFHVVLIPFTFGNLVIGAKWASVVFGTVALLSVWWVLDRQRTPYAGAWALVLLIVSEAFIFRLSMARTQSLSLVVLALGLHWLLTRRYLLLLPLSFVYVWLYDAFPLLLLLAGIYVLASRLTEGETRIRPLAYVALGTVLGLLVNPYFPENVVFAARHILPKFLDATSISVGNEWFPYTTRQLIENSGLALLAFISGVLALGMAGRRMHLRTATALGLALAFGIMLFEARRFVEYFPPFALIFAAFAWAPILQRARDRHTDRSGSERTMAVRGWVLAGLMAAPVLWIGARASLETLQGTKPTSRYQEASAWLAANSPAGARVFQTDWDDFPRLFFHNTHNRYIVGLDPSYLQLYDAALYDQWVELTQGDADDLSGEIRGAFGAEYALTDLKHSGFLRSAAEDPQFEEVYRDGEAAVFVIHEG